MVNWAGLEGVNMIRAIDYQKEGSIFEDMKKWNPTKHPGHAATVLKVEEVYSGSKKLL